MDYQDNYDGQEKEPIVLPSRYPNLLVNGASGIAVGMATNIPPHQLGEVIDAVLHLINDPEATVADLMDSCARTGLSNRRSNHGNFRNS